MVRRSFNLNITHSDFEHRDDDNVGDKLYDDNSDSRNNIFNSKLYDIVHNILQYVIHYKHRDYEHSDHEHTYFEPSTVTSKFERTSSARLQC